MNKLPAFLLVMFGGILQIANANPEGGVVSVGSAVINGHQAAVEIIQQSDRVAIDWQNFNIAAGEQTKFVQPNENAIALNRIHSDMASTIYGNLTANGKLILINQNGILFGETARVDVNGLLATTANIANEQFMQQEATNLADYKLSFAQPGAKNGKIINQGKITAKNGLVGLVAPHVANAGLIIAKAGKVKLGSGETFVLDLYGDNLMQIAVTEDLAEQLVLNSGKIIADGNEIMLTAAAGAEVVNSLIANTGVLQAQSLAKQQGEIIIVAAGSHAVVNNNAELKGLKAGAAKVLISGALDVSGLAVGEAGGKIKILGDEIALTDNALINASGHSGKYNTTLGYEKLARRVGAAGGEILIGGDYLGKGKTPTALELRVDPGVEIYADSHEIGDAGRVICWSDGVTSFSGKIYARSLGGALGNNYGDGGFVETSGHKKLAINDGAHVDLMAANGAAGTYLLDPNTVTIINSTATADNDATSTTQTSYSDTTVEANSQIKASYLVGLNADLMIRANDVIFNLNGEEMNLGTYGINIFASNSITASSPSTVTSSGVVYFEANNSLDFTNLTLNNSGGGVATITTNNGNMILDNITAYVLHATANNGNMTVGTITAGNANIYTQNGGDLTILSKASAGSSSGSGFWELRAFNPGKIILDFNGSTSINMPPVYRFALSTENSIDTINVGGVTGDSDLPCTINFSSPRYAAIWSYDGGTFDLYNITINNPLGDVQIWPANASLLKLGNVIAGGNLQVYSEGTNLTLSVDRQIAIGEGCCFDINTWYSGIFTIDFKNQNTLNLPSNSTYSWLYTETDNFATINIGEVGSSSAPCTIKSTGSTNFMIANGNGNPDANSIMDLSSITIDNTGGSLYIGGVYQANSIKVGNVTGTNVTIAAPSGSSAVTLAPATQIVAQNLAITAKDVIFDPAASAVVNILNNGTFHVNAANLINSLTAGTIMLAASRDITDATTVCDMTAQTGINVNNVTINGGTDSLVSLTNNTGEVILGNLNVGALSVEVSGAGGNIIIPENNQLVLTSTGDALVLNTVNGNIINQNTVESQAIQLVNPNATCTVNSANPTQNQNIIVSSPGLTVDLVGNYDNKNVVLPLDTPHKQVSVNNLYLRGPNKNNYVLSSTAVTADNVGVILPKTITASINRLVEKTYDGTVNADLTNGDYLALTGVVSTVNGSVDDVALVPVAEGNYQSTYNHLNADPFGTYQAVTVEGLSLDSTKVDAVNYELSSTTITTDNVGHINYRPVTITLVAPNGQPIEKTYDGYNNVTEILPANFTVDNIAPVDANDVQLNLTNAVAVYNNKDVGINKNVIVSNLELSGVNANNYTVNSTAFASIGQVDRRPVTATLLPSITKTYDGTTAAVVPSDKYTISGIIRDGVVNDVIGLTNTN